jgi:glycosyltransferase involved in cell wall biosynthesis
MFASNMFPSDADPSYGTFVAKSLEDLTTNSIEIKRVEVIRGRHSGIRKVFIYCKYFFNLLRNGFDHNINAVYVHYASHHCVPILLLNLIFKKNILIHIHGDDLAMRMGFTRRLLRMGQKQIFKRSKLVVLPSQFFLQLFETLFPELDQTKLYVSPSSGVDVNHYIDLPSRDIHYWNKFESSSCIFHLGYTGRIDQDKGWRLITEAYSLLPAELTNRIHLHFFGHGKEMKDLESFTSSIPVERATIHGHYSQENTAKIHESFDFHLVPSYRESLGLAAIEGLAAGNIVICSRIRPFTDYTIDNESAIHFEAGDARSLANAIIFTLSLAPESLINLSVNARKAASCFDRTEVSKQLTKVIRDQYA